jgi:hypothetical protein
MKYADDYNNRILEMEKAINHKVNGTLTRVFLEVVDSIGI